MAILCSDLLALPSFQKMTLLAGSGGLNRRLTWPYVGQTASVAEWVHGGELLFITGIGVDYSPETLGQVIRECVAKELCGLVILVGADYIRAVPEEVTALAEEAGLPLFQMPFDLKLIDVTSEIVDLIMRDKYERKRSKGFLERLLFSDVGETADAEELARTYRIELGPWRFVALLHIEAGEGGDYPQLDRLEDGVAQTVASFCRQSGVPLLTLLAGGNIVCLLSAQSQQEAQRRADYLRTVYQMLEHIYPGEKIYLSLGRSYGKDVPVAVSYQEAVRSLELCRRGPGRERVVSYDNLGIYRLLLKVEDREELRSYYRYFLDPLISYDADNHGELVETLRQFLLNDGNLIRTSQVMFIHRNTLVYRMNKIRELTGRTLDDATEKLELFSSLMVKTFLGE